MGYQQLLERGTTRPAVGSSSQLIDGPHLVDRRFWQPDVYDTDGLGSTADLTNSSASKTDGYTYDAFGAPTHSPGSSTQPFQFTGQQTDADSGLQYLRARYYDPGTGRFVGKDPINGSRSIPSTQNPYAYARNDPTTLSDPTGRYSVINFLNDLRPTSGSLKRCQMFQIVYLKS
jgi:RHS repeat-associated protein